MAIHKLSAKKLRTLPVGIYPDGGGLYLYVQHNGNSRYWAFRRSLWGKTVYVGIGKLDYVSLDAARKLVARINDAVLEGIHPKAFLESLAPPREEVKPSLNDVFEKAMRDIAQLKRWRHANSEMQWRKHMETYALPLIGDIPLDKITVNDVLRVMQPIWETKHVTAALLLNRLATFLNWATLHGYRTGENPAEWNGRLAVVLPKPYSVRNRQHYRAISIEEIPVLCEKLWNKPKPANLAILLGILTATRGPEFRKAHWDEFDFEKRIWSIPPARRKDKKPVPFRVPLSNEAIALLKKLPRVKDCLFPGRVGKYIHRNTPYRALHYNGYEVSMHGMRSTFRDWAAINRHDMVASEKALCHSVGTQVTRAYLRTDMLEERRKIMQEWADHCFKLINK